MSDTYLFFSMAKEFPHFGAHSSSEDESSGMSWTQPSVHPLSVHTGAGTTVGGSTRQTSRDGEGAAELGEFKVSFKVVDNVNDFCGAPVTSRDGWSRICVRGNDCGVHKIKAGVGGFESGLEANQIMCLAPSRNNKLTALLSPTISCEQFTQEGCIYLESLPPRTYGGHGPTVGGTLLLVFVTFIQID